MNENQIKTILIQFKQSLAKIEDLEILKLIIIPKKLNFLSLLNVSQRSRSKYI